MNQNNDSQNSGVNSVGRKTIQKPAMDQFSDFVVDNLKSFAIVLAVLIFFGGAYTVYSYMGTQKETDLQAQLAEIESRHFDLQTKIDEEKAKIEANKKDKKNAAVVAPVDHTAEMAKILEDFKALALKAPQTQAGRMSYIYLADIGLRENKADLIKEVTPVIEKNLQKDLVSHLAKFQVANFYVETGDCPQATKIYKEIVSFKGAVELHKEARLRTALCLEKMGEVAQAKSLLEEASVGAAGEDGFGSSQDAKKYLRYLNLSANSAPAATGEKTTK